MTSNKPKTPLQKAASSARLVGGLFVSLGAFPILFGWQMGAGLGAKIVSATTALILIGPGVWYLFAANHLTRGQIWVVRVAQRVAIAQIAMMALTLLAGFAIAWEAFVVPAILAIYFIPAQIAMIVELRKASRDPFIPQGHGFAVRVISVEEEKN